ncbi:hypothetical protein EOM81_12300 [bacterium]|nr:hypothetical protein [bacterium]
MERCLKIIDAKIKELEAKTKSIASDKEVWAARNTIWVLKDIREQIQESWMISEKQKMEEEMRG